MMEYKEYVAHAVFFENATSGEKKNTWDDWRLVPTSRPVINPPEAKRVEVEIPGADGIIDLTESLTGETCFKNRVGTIEFLVENRKQWFDVYSEILDFLHGEKMKIFLADDLDFFYTGRVYVNEWKSEEKKSLIVIEYNVDPYKFERYGSLEEWEWDRFNFETGIVREYKDLKVDGILSIVIPGRRKTVIPIFNVKSNDGNGISVSYAGATYTLPDGLSRGLNIVLKNGENILTFEGSGTVSIDYRGGRL